MKVFAGILRPHKKRFGCKYAKEDFSNLEVAHASNHFLLSKNWPLFANHMLLQAPFPRCTFNMHRSSKCGFLERAMDLATLAVCRVVECFHVLQENIPHGWAWSKSNSYQNSRHHQSPQYTLSKAVYKSINKTQFCYNFAIDQCNFHHQPYTLKPNTLAP
jgi:hypothetical protein